MRLSEFRSKLKTMYCLNPDVDFCNECIICKNTDKEIDNFIAEKVKVVAVWGKYGGNDFVLEKACPGKCKCEVCKEAFWIIKVDGDENNDVR